MNSINGYLQQCGDCPQPDGYIAYISMGYLTQKDFYGGLGYCKNGKHHTANVDWGAGPLNAYSLLAEHPGSHLQIGLYMVKQARKLAEGELDKDIKHLSKFFREFPSSTFYLRIGYEFDGEWNDYYPGEFVKAYRYLVDGLRKRKVTNVKYVWHACASPIDDIIEGYKEDLMPYYPGDEYVDWLAISWFLPPQVGPVGSSQKELSDELVAIARLKNKPLMIAESANQGYSNSDLTKRNITEILDGKAGRDRLSKSADQIWAEWYAPLFAWMEENGDVVKAFSYINANWDSQQMWGPPYKQGYWGDSRIEANEELKKRWKEEFSKPFWKEGR
ncbi:MAG: glycosyl hydrolase [Bacteroidota bacterium]